MRSRLEPFQKFVHMLRGIWMEFWHGPSNVSPNGAVEGMNNKIKSISHRSFGFRTADSVVIRSLSGRSLPNNYPSLFLHSCNSPRSLFDALFTKWKDCRPVRPEMRKRPERSGLDSSF